MNRFALFACFALSVNARADEPHWAFQPIRQPAIPAVTPTTVRNPIDAFVLAKLQAKGQSLSPVAEKRTLIRRLSFDLLGLPPSPDEVEAFVNDQSPDAYEKLVDRMLANSHYGERWARHWLDVARFADTKGYVFFEEVEYPWAWTYRDYVVRALNNDVGYDTFIRHQLAADLMPLGDDKRPLTALGFITIGGHFMSNPHDIIDDRIDVVTRGLIGLTVSCARCHDHKFDPVPAEDYYSLYGIFASSPEPNVPPTFMPPPDTDAYRAFAKELDIREKALSDYIAQKLADLIRLSKERVGEYMLTAHNTRSQPRTDDFMLIADGNDLNPTMLRRWQVYLETTRRKNHPAFVAWHKYAEFPEMEFVTKAPSALMNLEHPCNPIVLKSFTEKPPKSMQEVAQRYAEIFKAIDQSSQGKTKLDEPAAEELRLVFYGPDAPPKVTVGDVGELALLPDRASQAELQKFRKAVEQWRATGAGSVPRAHVVNDMPKPVEPFVFKRGNPYNRGNTVPRRFLEVLSGADRKPFTQGSGRLELADAIASPQNPLTARVFVNRVWMWHFGRGLVTTPSDFGTRSDPPSHPELLDYLASQFMKNGWSIKQLHRMIVLSATYQQQSLDHANGKKIDPENVLLWKSNRRRLDFESMRDALLRVSGRFDPTLGGPSTRDILGGNANRRTMYGYLDRLNVPGLYRTFDFPHPDATSPQRDETTVAPQALFLMNNVFVRDCATVMLRRPEVLNAKEPSAKVDVLYQLCYGRSPTMREREIALAYLSAPNEPGRSWEAFAQALMLTNEFVYVD